MGKRHVCNIVVAMITITYTFIACVGNSVKRGNIDMADSGDENKTSSALQSKRDSLLSPTTDLKYAFLVNPTMYYSTWQNYTLSLIENMVWTNKYATIYLDVPELFGMVYDDYINSSHDVDIEYVCQFIMEDQLEMLESKFVDFLTRMKEYNSISGRRIAIRGLRCNFSNAEISLLPHKYPEQKTMVDYMIRLSFGNVAQWTKNAEELAAYIKNNEDKLRKQMGYRYNLYLHIYNEIQHSLNKKRIKRSGSLTYDALMYLQSVDEANGRSIALLGPFQMRLEPGIDTFRSIIQHNLDAKSYIIYNIVDDSEKRVNMRQAGSISDIEMTHYWKLRKKI